MSRIVGAGTSSIGIAGMSSVGIASTTSIGGAGVSIVVGEVCESPKIGCSGYAGA